MPSRVGGQSNAGLRRAPRIVVKRSPTRDHLSRCRAVWRCARRADRAKESVCLAAPTRHEPMPDPTRPAAMAHAPRRLSSGHGSGRPGVRRDRRSEPGDRRRRGARWRRQAGRRPRARGLHGLRGRQARRAHPVRARCRLDGDGGAAVRTARAAGERRTAGARRRRCSHHRLRRQPPCAPGDAHARPRAGARLLRARPAPRRAGDGGEPGPRPHHQAALLERPARHRRRAARGGDAARPTPRSLASSTTATARAPSRTPAPWRAAARSSPARARASPSSPAARAARMSTTGCRPRAARAR